MLPPLPQKIYRKIGNSSLAGAVMGLIDPEFDSIAHRIIELPQTVELNTLPEFENDYIDALMIPNFNAGQFRDIGRR